MYLCGPDQLRIFFSHYYENGRFSHDAGHNTNKPIMYYTKPVLLTSSLKDFIRTQKSMFISFPGLVHNRQSNETIACYDTL